MLTLNDGRSELWQWDTGRKLTVDADCSQVHFSNKIFGRSIDVDVVNGVASIPDILLQTDKDLFAWAFVGTPENGYTKISKVFKVNRRNKPSDYVFTPPEQTTLGEILERLDDLESIQDPDAIKNAVEDYLEKNPPAAYTLPIATETTLGGVKAAAATEEMTQPVGITAEGKLVTVPGQNSGGNVELDTTLTQSGKAADAKAVGDKIAEITGISLVEPADDDIPKVFFSGDITGMSKDNEKVIQFAYKSRNADFGGYVKMKWQGSSTLAFPKKNFTIKTFDDEACESKLKKAFKHWGHEKNKYVLKADYIDHTHARNIVTANLWTEMVASRPDFDSLPDGMKNAPGHGAIDGFPIKLYMNGVYQGIYTWTIGKEDWMFGMDETNVNQAALCAEKNNDGNKETTDRNILACEFRGNANIDGNDWDLEFPETLNDNIKNSFNNLINCVKDTDDEAFKATIGNYLDLTSAFDYYILAYLSANVDGLGKNLVMLTYDGVKWFCSAYDMDNIWGSRGTSSFISATYPCPESYYDNNSLLWQRIEECFGTELYERYKFVRKAVLSFENVITKFERFCDLIGTELYAEDVEIYSGIPYPNDNNLKQIRNFFTPRAEYVDGCFAGIGAGETPDTPDIDIDPEEHILYALPEARTFNGTSDWVDTNVNLWGEDQDFTIAFDATPVTGEKERVVFECNSTRYPYSGAKFVAHPTKIGFYKFWLYGSEAGAYEGNELETKIPYNASERFQAVITHKAFSGEYTLDYKWNGEVNHVAGTVDFFANETTLRIGADNTDSSATRYWEGTMHDFKIYDIALSGEQVANYLNG